MAKIVQMNTYRRKRGAKLKVPRQSRYLVALRFPRFIRDRRKTSSRIYAVTRAFIDEMGGFSLARKRCADHTSFVYFQGSSSLTSACLWP